MKTAVTIGTDGSITEFVLDDANGLEQLQALVGGWLEGVDLGDAFMYVNEEGKIDGLPVNASATLLFHAVHGPHDIIVGNVVLVGQSDENGDETSLSESQVATMLESVH